MKSIKELRNKRRESQTDLANAIGVSLRTIQNYESGAVDAPSKKLELIAQHYGVSVGYLYKDLVNQYMSEDFNTDNNSRVESHEEIYVKDKSEVFPTKSGNIVEELSSGKYLLTVPLVPFKAYAMYISEHQDAEYIHDLTKVSFIVDRVPQGKYMAWEIQNDSMNDAGPGGQPSREAILHGDIVLARELGRQHWKNTFHLKSFPFWIIVHKDTIVCKQIVHHDVEKGVITCHSLNNSPEYQDFDLSLNEVHQLFNIIKKQI